jgi:chromosome partitioning protein
MRTLTFASIKGGVGKTTLSAHTAAALADRGLRTLLLDLDPQGHASALVGVELEPSDSCLGDALVPTSQVTLQEVLRETSREGLLVAPASARMTTLERDLFRWGHRLTAIQRALKTLDELPDALVLDTPPRIDAYTEAALSVGDVIVVPVPAMAHALQGLDEIYVCWQDVSDKGGGEMVIAVNLWDRRTSATNAAIDKVLGGLAMRAMGHRVLRAEVLNQAGLALELVFDYGPRSQVALCLNGLAGELWDLAGELSGDAR